MPFDRLRAHATGPGHNPGRSVNLKIGVSGQVVALDPPIGTGAMPVDAHPGAVRKPAEQSPVFKWQAHEPASTNPAGKAMCDDDDRGMIFSGLGDLGQDLQHPLCDLGRTLPGRRSAYVLTRPKPLRQLGVSRPDFLTKQTFPRTDMDLTQPLVGDDFQSGALVEHLGGLMTPRKVAGVQAGRLIPGKHLRCSHGLLIAKLIERYVGLTLK